MGYTRHTLLLLLLGACALLIYLGFHLQGRSQEKRVHGEIVGFRLTEGYTGTKGLAFVKLDDGRTISLSTTEYAACKPGDRVEVRRRSVVFGTRYWFGPAGCIAQK